MYIIFLGKKVWFSCLDVHFIYKKKKSCDFTFLTPSPLQKHCTTFWSSISVVNYCLCLNEFRIFIYLLCFEMKQPRKIKITELQYRKSI